MSLFVDQKYLLLISNRLPLFKKKSGTTYNCRCTICGDSLKDKRKARGYFFKYKNELRYKCHNCDASLSFGSFLKTIDTTLHQQYALERYSEGTLKKPPDPLADVVFKEPVFRTQEERLLDKLLERLDALPENHEAVQYCLNRQIPKDKLKLIYFIENVKDIAQLKDTYKELIRTTEPRIVFPFYDERGQLAGVTCRAIRDEALRYITVKIKDDVPLLFGTETLDYTKQIFVVEGPIDSLFLDNCFACGGTSFQKINMLNIEKDQLTLIFDNQPRNKEVCKIIGKCIDQGYNVVIWPQSIEEKDINGMVIAGYNIKNIIVKNTYQGLTAKAKFIGWRRC